MRKLKVDLAELTVVFDSAWGEMSHYLDLETGQVIMVSSETRRQLEAIYEEAYDPAEKENFALNVVLQQTNLSEWEKEALLEAGRVEAGYGTRYIAVPEADSGEGYRDMEDFIATVRDERLQDRLWQAIRGRGAFGRFKDVLSSHFHERECWFEFQEARLLQRVLEWLKEEGIEPIIEEAPLAQETAPEVSTRARLIAEVLAFVRAAAGLPGVLRIALIGSLATDEPDPKDADLLVTVTDEADLASLAGLGRKLQGHAQSFNRGGEVFLAGPRGGYLGRTCPWKQCDPGIRASCDALHCGRRLYLHDDLAAIHLSGDLIAAPPIELWPEVIARVPVPEDVEQLLLLPLREPPS
jgi:predicted nucleotidyltransferase